jgi:lipopolysaccharide export system permease protein
MSRRTLQFYIGRRFLIGILGAFLLCTILIFIIDFVEMLRQAGKSGDVPATTLLRITLLRVPAYTEFLLPFAVLVGSIVTLLNLSRKSELAVMRASGMSVWQFLKPGLIVSFALGVFAVLVYNPLAAGARATAEAEADEAFGRESSVLRSTSSGSWLRQDGLDGQSVINASQASHGGNRLSGVNAFVFDRDGRFLEKIDGATAELHEGYWAIKDAMVARVGQPPETYQTYLLSTYLTPERVADALGSVISLSFWELPALIEVAEKAKLSTAPLRIQYELLLSRPLLCVAMVLLGATVSLRSFRSGGIQTMVITGMVGGFGFFLMAEISRQIGTAGLAPASVAVWMPVTLAILVTTTILLHQEDG